MKLCVSAVIFQLFKIIRLENYVLTILELNWNQRLGHKKTKLNICHHMPTSSTQLQNWSFHVVERTRTSTKCEKNEICTCNACKNTIFHCQICKFVGFLLLSSSWLLRPGFHMVVSVVSVVSVVRKKFIGQIEFILVQKVVYVVSFVLSICTGGFYKVISVL